MLWRHFPPIPTCWLWESETPPDGWYFCDGSNGTPDMRDYFIEKQAWAAAGVRTGDGTVTAAATITHNPHDHDGGDEVSDFTASYHVVPFAHPDHTLSDNYVWLPPYYSLAFIMKA